jgi:NAD-dependent dihydropyrimidine dehydrogenase PreA subunit
MIELLISERCTRCNRCVDVCPSDVFDPVPAAPPAIARQLDCQSCYLCELYCAADALYVGPDCERPEPVKVEDLLAAGVLGQYRRDSGWDEWSGHQRNLHWRMGTLFSRAAVEMVDPEPDH